MYHLDVIPGRMLVNGFRILAVILFGISLPGTDTGARDMAHTVIQQIEDYSYATRIDKWVEAGATSMVLRAPVKHAVGRTLIVDPGTNKERVVISAVQDNTVTFAPALSNAYQAGTVVEWDVRVVDKVLFVPCSAAWNTTAAAAIVRNERFGFPFPDSAISKGFANFIVPEDYVGDMTIWAVIFGGGTGTTKINHSTIVLHDTNVGDGFTNNSVVEGPEDQVAALINVLTQKATVTGLGTTREYFLLEWERDAVDIADTVADTIYFLGFEVRYKGSDK